MVIGKTKQFIWDYSEYSDILNIHRKGKKTAGSAELGDFTIDFDNIGHIVGLEIMNVADFLKESEISLEQLSCLVSAEMIFKQRKSGVIYIWIKFVFPQNIEKKIPIPAPVLAEAA